MLTVPACLVVIVGAPALLELFGASYSSHGTGFLILMALAAIPVARAQLAGQHPPSFEAAGVGCRVQWGLRRGRLWLGLGAGSTGPELPRRGVAGGLAGRCCGGRHRRTHRTWHGFGS